MKTLLISTGIVICLLLFSCNKNEPYKRIYSLGHPLLDTIELNQPVKWIFDVNYDKAKLTIYLGHSVPNFEKKLGISFEDNFSDSSYITPDMKQIGKMGKYEKNKYNKQYYNLFYEWTPTLQEVEPDKVYYLLFVTEWQVQGEPRSTAGGYVYVKKADPQK